MIHNTRGIDAVLDGHSHSVIIGDRYPNADGEDVILSSVGTKMANAGELIIGKDGTIETLLVSEYDHEDETVRAAIDQADKELEEILSYKVGTIDFDLTIADENGIRIVRTRETNAGDFAADAIRSGYLPVLQFAWLMQGHRPADHGRFGILFQGYPGNHRA